MDKNTLEDHLNLVKSGDRRFENAFQAVTRMILGDSPEDLEKNRKLVTVNGEQTYDYQVFRQGEKHVIGMHYTINSFVNFVKDAANGGSAGEMAFVLVGEPGNGKTFFVDYLCSLYRQFTAQPENRRYTFRFKNLDAMTAYKNLPLIESQTYEDPMILAMNLGLTKDHGKAILKNNFGFEDSQIDKSFKNYRPLGACSDYILNDIKSHIHDENNIAKILEFVDIVPVPISETLGSLTGKYPAKDKITSSAADLLGDEDVQRLLRITDTNHPFKFNLRRGALARVAGGGIHFADEKFKNKKDLIQVYLGVVQNRKIEIDGFAWPMDTLIIATSNTAELQNFMSDKGQAPIIDRCRFCYVSHNTDYRLQQKLTDYALGRAKSIDEEIFGGKALHQDPNLNYLLSVAVTLTRHPTNQQEKLSPIELLKLGAGESIEDKSFKTLIEVKDGLDRNPDVRKRWGQFGLGQRDIFRTIQLLKENAKTQEGGCIFAGDVFETLEKVILNCGHDDQLLKKYRQDLKTAKTLYVQRIKKEMFDAYAGHPEAIRKDVMRYVNMVVGIVSNKLDADDMWIYKDSQTRERKAIKVDRRYVEAIESRMGLMNEETRNSFRDTIIKAYGLNKALDDSADFMDNSQLVEAVTDVKLTADIGGLASDLVGALANRIDPESAQLYDKLLRVMVKPKKDNGLGYCKTCAEKTIELFCTKDGEV